MALLLGSLLVVDPSIAAKKKDKEEDQEAEQEGVTSATFSGLKLRGIGPAIASGRISDLAVQPHRRKVYYVAAASGGVWKTTNAGTTFEPIFDSEGSYSIGALALDPQDPKILWVGTGENNSQRSVSYGDGIYRSIDGGTTFEKLGLEGSEHIGMIRIDPRDSDTVWVAAQGPLWRSGGDRGLYRTTDGGKSWERKIHIDEYTGISEVHLDPRNPNVLYAVAYQRARRVWTLINGGPGSGLHKSTDGGETWQQLDNGLPKEDMGRIGLAISPTDPDRLYAIIEARGDGKGVYRSTDGGSNWEKRSDYVSSSPQYYQELVPDPVDPHRLYSLDTYNMVSDDGGKSWSRLGEEFKHVDNHALWIDPDDPEYLLVGCDGGLYDSYDRGKTWSFRANLPITQFYKIAADNATPFYNVYGGTQDNFTLGGPSRTRNQNGITNRDWFVAKGGDGFEPQVDPTNPNIVYAQSQYGNLVRFDRRTGEQVDIKPRAEPGDEPLRWNWDSPLLISPHDPDRLYFGAQRIFRSDDRGSSWQVISGDLSRGLDRNQLEVMGRVWGIDAVAKSDSTSIYGNVVAFAESPRVEGLLYAGTDDGLIHILEPGQENWLASGALPGIPELSYVAFLEASHHDDNTVYAVLNNHKSGDFKPYLLRSRDRGKSWESIAADLPERGSTWTIVEDPEDPSLLFVGTEFGLFVSLGGGDRWVELSSGLPTIAVRDLEIQAREVDLVVGTFGRGFYVLDDYRALRDLDWDDLESGSRLFPPRPASTYIEASPIGGDGSAFQGHGFYTAPNPPHGAVLTYYLAESTRSRRDERKRLEKEALDSGNAVPYPSFDELRLEEEEVEPRVLLTISDNEGRPVRRLEGPAKKGFHRITWDLRWPSARPITNSDGNNGTGPLVVPGTYRVALALETEAGVEELAPPVELETRPLDTAPGTSVEASMTQLRQEVALLQRAVLGTVAAAREATSQLEALQQAAERTPTVSRESLQQLRSLTRRLAELRRELEGDRLLQSRNEATLPSIQGRVQALVSSLWSSTSLPTQTQHRSREIASQALATALESLRTLLETELPPLIDSLEAAGAPWTPGRRLPVWSGEVN